MSGGGKWLGYHQLQKEARGGFQEFSKLLKSSLVYDMLQSLESSQSLSANLLMEQIVEASVLGDIQQVDFESAQSHIQHVEPAEKADLIIRLELENTSKVNVLRLQRGNLIGRKEVREQLEVPFEIHLWSLWWGRQELKELEFAIEALHLEKENFNGAISLILSTSTTELGRCFGHAQSMGIELRAADPKEQMV